MLTSLDVDLGFGEIEQSDDAPGRSGSIGHLRQHSSSDACATPCNNPAHAVTTDFTADNDKPLPALSVSIM
jgi:hypothetical protein